MINAGVDFDRCASFNFNNQVMGILHKILLCLVLKLVFAYKFNIEGFNAGSTIYYIFNVSFI